MGTSYVPDRAQNQIKSNVSLIKQLSDRNCTVIHIEYQTVSKVNNYHETASEQQKLQ